LSSNRIRTRLHLKSVLVISLLSGFLFCGGRNDEGIEKLNISLIKKNLTEKINHSLNDLGESSFYPRSVSEGEKWKTAPIKNWTSGFFPGILWYMNELTNNDTFKTQAQKWTNGLSPIRDYTGSHDVGFIVFCSFGNGFRLTHRPEYKNILLQTANNLSKRYSSKVGCIKSWDNSKWGFPVIIDNMMNLELLFWASKNGGDENLYNIAFSHAVKTMENHFRPDGSTYHVVNYDSSNGNVLSRGTHQGFSDSSCWSRGQAWAIYGFTMAYRYSKDPKFLKTAQKAADYFISHLPKDKIPFWDFNATGDSNMIYDASAAAVASSALFELSLYGNNENLKNKYYENGLAILESLTSDKYFSDPSKSIGLINHAVGNKPANDEIDVSLIYGDYYFIEALVRYTKYDKSDFKF